MPASPFFVTVPNGLVPTLAAELQTLGMAAQPSGAAAARCEGGLEAAYRACLWSRIGNRVLWPLLRETIQGPDDLYRVIHDFPWEEHMESHATLAIDASGKAQGLDHTHFAALKVKDAICDRFRERAGRRPDIDPERPDIRLNLRLNRGRAELSLDLSGGSLHRRGYRAEAGAAPLKENLAAGLLLLSGWPEKAAEGVGFLDPLCGSGALVIEAALMAADVAPGLLRPHFGFKAWKHHDAAVWADLYREADGRRAKGLQSVAIPLLGRDRDERVLASAAANACRAGIAGLIEFRRASLEQAFTVDAKRVLVVTNPPYGERLGNFEALRGLYARLGQNLRAMPHGEAAIFSSEPDLCAYLGLSPIHTDVLYNGALEARLFHYENQENEEATPLLNRLNKNARHLRKWAKRTGVQAFRVYDADLPEFAFAVDLYQTEDGAKDEAQYEEHVHLQEYAPPDEIDARLAERRRLTMTAAVAQALDMPIERVLLKTRARQRGRRQYEAGERTGAYRQVREGKARLWVNLEAYLDTGLFLDHRPLRRRIAAEAKGKRFLNLFCYTAAASVQAALGGALETTSLDLSATYLNWAASNFALNTLDARDHDLVRADARLWLREALERRLRFDLILLDPPTFSNSKRMEGVLDIQRDHVELIRNGVKLLHPGGVLYFSNNFRKFRLDERALGNLDVQDITKATLDEDFRRNPRIHRCWKIQRTTSS